MEVIVLEGPAGSGKSTVLKQIEESWDEGYINLSNGLELPRDHGSPLPSYARDMAAIYNIVCEEQYGYIALDRFWFSTLVYDSLRQQGFFSSDIIEHHRESLNDLIQVIGQNFKDRGFYVNESIRFTFYLLLPPIQEVLDRRESTGKVYPFDAGAELALYRRILSTLQCGYYPHDDDEGILIEVKEWKTP